MGQSDGTWGELIAHDNERAEVWDGFRPLPVSGVNVALDAFCERKNLSIESLIRIGARLASEHVLAFAGPGYIKYRDVVSNERWSYADCDWSKLRIVRAGPEPSDTVIVAEGETDAAWLTMRAGCDVAILPAGALYFPASYAEQLREYEQVLAATDTDSAGEKGAALILDALPQAQRYAPPANDWCASDELPPFPEKPEFHGETVGGLFFEDLKDLLENGVPPPDVLVDDLIYTEGVHWISGHPGSGKTTLCMYVAILVMLEGRDVVWLDYEGGVRPTVRRLLESGCPVDVALKKFHYSGWPVDAPAYFKDLAERWPNAMIVLDSASKALQGEGKDENSPGEVTAWAVPIVKAAKQHGLPILVIDHVTKSATETTKYSRGAGSKQADADIAWFVKCETPFNRTTVGTISVHQQKDREGYMPFTNWYQVGDGAGGLPVMPSDGPDEGPVDEQGQPPI